jgi:hypothetical protein
MVAMTIAGASSFAGAAAARKSAASYPCTAMFLVAEHIAEPPM